MEHLGDKLKKWRLSKEWKQPEMADFLDIGHRTYQSIEKTGEVKKADDLDRILKKTGIPLTQIIAQNGAKISADKDLLIIELQKDVLRLEARVNVLLITLADIVSKVDKKAIAIVDRELVEAANREAEFLLEELRKKWS